MSCKNCSCKSKQKKPSIERAYGIMIQIAVGIIGLCIAIGIGISIYTAGGQPLP